MRVGYRCILLGSLIIATCGFGVTRPASYQFADMIGANLARHRLIGANLSSADLQSADLRSCDLRRADLSSACLVNADLRGADLRGANLTGANLSAANLRGARLDDARLGGVMYSEDTRWPSGFIPERRHARHGRPGPRARYFQVPHPGTLRHPQPGSPAGSHRAPS